MRWKTASIVGGALALIAATATALGNVETILGYIPYVTKGDFELRLAGGLEPLSRSLRVQSSKQAAAEVNSLQFQLSFLLSKKAELEILQKTEDSLLLREALSEIESQLEETKANLSKAKCDQINISSGVDAECSTKK